MSSSRPVTRLKIEQPKSDLFESLKNIIKSPNSKEVKYKEYKYGSAHKSMSVIDRSFYTSRHSPRRSKTRKASLPSRSVQEVTINNISDLSPKRKSRSNSSTLNEEQISHILNWTPYNLYKVMSLKSEDYTRRLFISRYPRLNNSDIGILTNNKIRVVISLLHNKEVFNFDPVLVNSIYQSYGIRFLNFPIPDMDVPKMELAWEFIPKIAEMLMRDNVLIHCLAGKGRSGTIAACVLMQYGYTSEQAIKIVRRQRFGAISTIEQENFIFEYEKFLPNSSSLNTSN